MKRKRITAKELYENPQPAWIYAKHLYYEGKEPWIEIEFINITDPPVKYALWSGSGLQVKLADPTYNVFVENKTKK